MRSSSMREGVAANRQTPVNAAYSWTSFWAATLDAAATIIAGGLRYLLQTQDSKPPVENTFLQDWSSGQSPPHSPSDIVHLLASHRGTSRSRSSVTPAVLSRSTRTIISSVVRRKITYLPSGSRCCATYFSCRNADCPVRSTSRGDSVVVVLTRPPVCMGPNHLPCRLAAPECVDERGSASPCRPLPGRRHRGR